MLEDVSVSNAETNGLPLVKVPTTSGLFSTVIPRSRDASRLALKQYWLKKTVLLAIALGCVPVALTGGLIYWMSTQALDHQRQQLEQHNLERHNPGLSGSTTPAPEKGWLMLMLFLTGGGAIASGAMAWLWLKILVNAVIRESAQGPHPAEPQEVSNSLQGLGQTIDLLQSLSTVAEILKVGVAQVQQHLQADRTFILGSGGHSETSFSPACNAEVVAPGIARLFTPDGLSQPENATLEVSLSQLFSLHPGYVQVCSEVRGSDLPLPQQRTLSALGVQAQLVTQIMADDEPIGVLVVQQVAHPRDWTELEHQLFAALAQQIGLAVARCSTAEAGMRSPFMGFSRSDIVRHRWQDYQSICLNLLEESTAQVESVNQAVDQIQSLSDVSQALNSNVSQLHQTVQQNHQLLQESQTSVNLSINSMTEIQETMIQVHVGAQQLSQLSQKVTQISAQMKTISEQINYQAMNASITAGRNADGAAESKMAFTNQILEMTRQLKRHALDLETLSDHIVHESHTLTGQGDTGQEQMLVGAEWFREARQALNQLVAINAQLESGLLRLLDTTDDQINEYTSVNRQMLELSNLVNYTQEQSKTLADSMEQFMEQAPA